MGGSIMKDYLGYNGKVCVVTGAASGMGKATTEILVDLGAEVYALDVAEATTPGIKKFIKVNLGEKASIDEAFDQLPNQIDCFFGIAGVSGQTTDFVTTVTINYIANKYITDEYLKERMNPGGAIVYVTSGAGLAWEKPEYVEEYKPIVDTVGWDETLNALEKLNFIEKSGPFGYIFSKRVMNYYISTLVSVFGEREGEKKVRVNGVLPAATQSGQTDDFVKNAGGMDKMIESTGYSGRLAESKEIAEPLVFLNSKMASFLSGVLLDVDFGQNNQTIVGVKPESVVFGLKFLQ